MLLFCFFLSSRNIFSDDSTRQQEHEAAYGLLSLSQKTSPGLSPFTQDEYMSTASSPGQKSSPTTPLSESIGFIDTDEVTHVSQKNFVKNKILDQRTVLNFSAKQLSELPTIAESDSEDSQALKFLGKTSVSRPLTYPYTSPVSEKEVIVGGNSELKSIRHFQVIQNYNQELKNSISPVLRSPQVLPIVKVNDKMVLNSNSNNSDGAPADLRKRKVAAITENYKQKIQRSDSEVMDLSVPEKRRSPDMKYNGRNHVIPPETKKTIVNNDVYTNLKKNFEQLTIPSQPRFNESSDYYPHNNHQRTVFPIKQNEDNCVSINYVIEDRIVPAAEYDNSAMETLADIATKQVKLEKNSVAKNVATEFLKLATKNEFVGSEGGLSDSNSSGGKKVNELLVKPEENKSCTICSKSFSKPSQLR